ncbi:unnamed protein product [Arctogadus glacialis]
MLHTELLHPPRRAAAQPSLHPLLHPPRRAAAQPSLRPQHRPAPPTQAVRNTRNNAINLSLSPTAPNVHPSVATVNLAPLTNTASLWGGAGPTTPPHCIVSAEVLQENPLWGSLKLSVTFE